MKLFASLALAVLTAPAIAAEFWVTSSADSGPGSLREAITAMNVGLGGTHTIRFDLGPAPAPIVLASSLPPLAKKAVTIIGTDEFDPDPVVVIDGDGQHPIFTASVGDGNAFLALSHLTLRNGRREGNGGCLVVITADGPPGLLSMQDVVMRNCRAQSAQGDLQGGAVFTYNRNLHISFSRFEDNIVDGAGGALSANGASPGANTVDIFDTHFIGNRTQGGLGGQNGGALNGLRVDAYVYRTRFIGNETSYSGVGVNDFGAAVHLSQGTLQLEESVIHRNRSGAGLVVADGTGRSTWMTVRNTSIVDNDVGRGAALTFSHDRIEVRNNTVLDLRTDDYFRPTGVFQFYTGDDPDAVMVLSNNLFGPTGQPSHRICGTSSGSTVELHANLAVGAIPGCGLDGSTTLADLAIDALRDNGGAVETVSLRADSAALMAGTPGAVGMMPRSLCMPVDARDVNRPTDSLALGFARCDVGAWESEREASLFRDDFQPVLWRLP